jgi:CO/xanthine dehydrogenase FAD-binding subunit
VSLARDVACARPASLEAALSVRAEHPDWVVLAGGTDLMVPHGPPMAADGVLDLFGLADLHGVGSVGDEIHIGACTTYAELVDSPIVRDRLPLLHAAALEVGAVQVRERGTIGGNVVTASPVGDMLPGLLALDATIVVRSSAQQRSVPYEAFIAGYRRVHLAPDEIVTSISIPGPDRSVRQHWRKVGSRSALAISKVSIAGTARVEGGAATQVRLAFGAVAEVPLRLHGIEQLIEGAVPDRELAERVRTEVRAALHPIGDVRSTADYRRDVAAGLAARFVTDLAEPGSGVA